MSCYKENEKLTYSGLDEENSGLHVKFTRLEFFGDLSSLYLLTPAGITAKSLADALHLATESHLSVSHDNVLTVELTICGNTCTTVNPGTIVSSIKFDTGDYECLRNIFQLPSCLQTFQNGSLHISFGVKCTLTLLSPRCNNCSQK